MSSPNRFTEKAQIQEQYKTEANLALRIETHEKYTIPKLDFTAWILDHISWIGSETILDVGCGTGAYADPALDRGGRYIAGDLSLGMLRSLPPIVEEKINLNAQQIPLRDDAVDVVFANHMLYHVLELSQGLQEIRRVLKPGGYLIAATNSGNYMPELGQLQREVAERFGLNADALETASPMHVQRFNLENGGAILGKVFDNVERYLLDGALIFTEAQPLIDYLGTMRGRYLAEQTLSIPWEAVAAALLIEIDRHISSDGNFTVSKLTGVFVCSG